MTSQYKNNNSFLSTPLSFRFTASEQPDKKKPDSPVHSEKLESRINRNDKLVFKSLSRRASDDHVTSREAEDKKQSNNQKNFYKNRTICKELPRAPEIFRKPILKTGSNFDSFDLTPRSALVSSKKVQFHKKKVVFNYNPNITIAKDIGGNFIEE